VEAQGGVVVPCAGGDGRVDPGSLLAELFRRGGRAIMVEGGPTLAAAFLARGLVDRWLLYVAPVYAGDGVQWPRAGAAPAEGADGFRLTGTRRCGDDLRLVYDRLPFAQLLHELTDDTAAGLRRRAGET
jgi:riboflavin biosynthesis pyrimidine reductase